MNYFKQTTLLLLVFLTGHSIAQTNSYDKLGFQALMKGDFKAAVSQLEKADTKDPSNVNVLKMLGYSYYQCGNFENAVSTYSRYITLKPVDYSAYYYRGKARLNVANDPRESLNQMRESFYLSSIKDFSKAIELNGEEDAQLLQNRGLAYKDYAIYKSYKIKKAIDKAACITLFNSAVTDFQKILVVQPQRIDITNLIAYVKAQITSLK
ncbi:tetratricopeptide (TPR) repeat protein [Pedobacter sp. UYP24]